MAPAYSICGPCQHLPSNPATSAVLAHAPPAPVFDLLERRKRPASRWRAALLRFLQSGPFLAVSLTLTIMVGWPWGRGISSASWGILRMQSAKLGSALALPRPNCWFPWHAHQTPRPCSCQPRIPMHAHAVQQLFLPGGRPLDLQPACLLLPPARSFCMHAVAAPSPSCHLARVDPVQRLAPRGRRPQVRRPVLPGLFILCARILCLGGCGRLPGQPALCSEVRHRPLMLGRSSLGRGPCSSCSQRTRHCWAGLQMPLAQPDVLVPLSEHAARTIRTTLTPKS